MKYYLNDPPYTHNEEYIVKYWGVNTEGFKQQFLFSIFFAGKNKHKQAIVVSCRINKHKTCDVISCSYQ